MARCPAQPAPTRPRPARAAARVERAHRRGAARRAQGGGDPQALAWFGAVAGAALVPGEGALGRSAAPAAALVLTEGGQLMVHDLETLQPAPLTLAFQGLPPATAARFLGPVRPATPAALS